MFKIGDKVFYPMYGAGTICGIEERKILGEKKTYFTMKMPLDDAVAMIPTDTCESIGVRYIISEKEASKALSAFKSEEVSEDENWNKRHRDNMDKLRTGDIYQLIGVVKGLMLRDKKKGLSTSERKMLGVAKQMFISEIVLTGSANQNDVESILDDTIAQML
ncbi:MAG TPA: CarD family transcriptional regulator [Clostridiales bacterium]|nr:CarD family transcriptional regulator [Clostridiales bacterium]